MEHFEHVLPRSGYVLGAPQFMSRLDKVGTHIETVSSSIADTVPAASVLFFTVFAVRLGLARLRQRARSTQVAKVEVLQDNLECAHC